MTRRKRFTPRLILSTFADERELDLHRIRSPCGTVDRLTFAQLARGVMATGGQSSEPAALLISAGRIDQPEPGVDVEELEAGTAGRRLRFHHRRPAEARMENVIIQEPDPDPRDVFDHAAVLERRESRSDTTGRRSRIVGFRSVFATGQGRPFCM